MESENFRNIWTNNKEEFYKTLEDLLSIDKDSLYYIVGSDKFIKDVLEAIKKYHIELDRILIDKRDEKKIEFFEKPQS